MKKAFIVLLIALTIAAPVFAAPAFDLDKATKGTFGAGLNLGSAEGAVVKFDNSTWDVYANVGYLVFGGTPGFSVELGGEFKVSEFSIEDVDFDINAGLMIPVYLGGGFGFGAQATIGTSYDFSIKDIGSFQAYVRLGLGVQFQIAGAFTAGIGGSGALGLVYLFK